jgi:hypothetical protein
MVVWEYFFYLVQYSYVEDDDGWYRQILNTLICLFHMQFLR